MSDILTQLGVGGILVILVLKEVFSFLGKEKKDQKLSVVPNGKLGEANADSFRTLLRHDVKDALTPLILEIGLLKRETEKVHLDVVKLVERSRHGSD